jgi:tryptophan synthase alpha chain
MKNNRINQLMQSKKANVLSIFFTAGYPSLSDTTSILKEIQRAGADLVEIGIPFSDPLADGEVIQQSSRQALNNGMTLDLLFSQLKNIREEISIPLVLMGYFNPILQFGVKAFLSKCNETGIDGVIIPDLPADVYEESYRDLFEAHGIAKIFLITPHTPPARIRYIDSLSNGFLYLVSSSSTTGKEISFRQDLYESIRSMELKNPLLIGFGISDKRTFNEACMHANGAIIGSAFIKALEHEKPAGKIPSFISSILS